MIVNKILSKSSHLSNLLNGPEWLKWNQKVGGEEEELMRVAIHNDRTDLAEAFKLHVERRLRFALGRFGDRVGQVTVRIYSEGPREIYCRISTEIQPFGHVAVEESDTDLFSAIDRATARIGWLFGRELERTRDARVGHESVRLVA